MIWFTATNEGSLDQDSFFELLAAAVLSARENTTLDPHLLYEGRLNHPRIEWLEEVGVTVVPHALTFRDQIEAFFKAEGYGREASRRRAGAYLRSELPVVLRERSFGTEYVLYTDCDVLFMRDPDLNSLRPTYFAAYGPWEGGYTRFHLGGRQHFNSGVMLMNIPQMADRCDAFIDFVLHDGYDVDRPGGRYWNKHLLRSDQVAYNLFYRNEIDDLLAEYNWNPSKGKNEDAIIIHFNGLKWNQVDNMKEGRINKSQYRRLYQDAGGAYEHYRETANSLLNMARFPPDLGIV